ncbi:MAG: phage terminase small subunit [Pseudomonadota bacterium]
MSLSPVQRAKARAEARRAAAQDPHGGPVSGDAHTLLLAQLVEHRRRLKDIQSVERKIEAKRVFLPTYDAWIDATLAEGRGAQDPIVTTVMVWHIDAGNYARALAIARYAVRHQLDLPDQYERSLAVALIDEFAAAALAGKLKPAEAAEILPEVHDLTAGADAPDQARAKLHKAYAYALLGKTGPADVDFTGIDRTPCEEAQHHLKRALELWDQVGVKKDIERLDRRLKADGPSA